MAAYVIADVEVTDPTLFAEYSRQVPDSLGPYGGRFLVRGGRFEQLEGDWSPRRLVVLEFPSLAQAKAWYASPLYQVLLGLRLRCARTDLVLVDGVAPPAGS